MKLSQDDIIEPRCAIVAILPESEHDFRDKMAQKKSIQEVLDLSQSFVVAKNRNRLECWPCKVSGMTTKFHVKYDFQNAGDFDPNAIFPHGFSQLKNSVTNHIFRNQTHHWLATNENIPPTKRDLKAGMCIGRRIYGIVLGHDEHQKLKQELFRSWQDNVKIGNINHSVYILRKFLPCLYECMRGVIREELSEVNPVLGPKYITLAADKVTLNRINYHVIGLFWLHEEAGVQTGIQPVYLGIIENKDGKIRPSAKEILTVTMEVLGISKENLQKR